MAWLVCCSNHRDTCVITCNPSGWQTLLMLWSIFTRFQVTELDPLILFKTSMKWWPLSTDSYQTQPSVSSLYAQITILREAFSVGTDKRCWLSCVKKVSKSWIRIKRCFPISTFRGKGKFPQIRKNNWDKASQIQRQPCKDWLIWADAGAETKQECQALLKGQLVAEPQCWVIRSKP